MLAKFEFINMTITKPSLISRRNLTLAGTHHSALINTLTLGTSLFMYNNNNVHKMGTEEISPTSRSAISNFMTNPCL